MLGQFLRQIVFPALDQLLNFLEFALIQPDTAACRAAIDDDPAVAAVMDGRGPFSTAWAGEFPVDFVQLDAGDLGGPGDGASFVGVESYFSGPDDVLELAGVELGTSAIFAGINSDPLILDRSKRHVALWTLHVRTLPGGFP